MKPKGPVRFVTMNGRVVPIGAAYRAVASKAKQVRQRVEGHGFPMSGAEAMHYVLTRPYATLAVGSKERKLTRAGTMTTVIHPDTTGRRALFEKYKAYHEQASDRPAWKRRKLNHREKLGELVQQESYKARTEGMRRVPDEKDVAIAPVGRKLPAQAHGFVPVGKKHMVVYGTPRPVNERLSPSGKQYEYWHKETMPDGVVEHRIVTPKAHSPYVVGAILGGLLSEHVGRQKTALKKAKVKYTYTKRKV
jgi:hypothetical protein